MKKFVVPAFRWFWIMVGAISATIGFFAPSLANETNNVCLVSVFLAFAPYPEKK